MSWNMLEKISAMVKFVLEWSKQNLLFLALCVKDWPVLAFTVDTIFLL